MEEFYTHEPKADEVKNKICIHLFCLGLQFDNSSGECNDSIADRLLTTVIHNEQEAYAVYCAYAHHCGFTVRKDHANFWPNSRNIKTKDFLCGKAGFKKEAKITETFRYKKADNRTGCPAMIRYEVDNEGNWMVKKFVESHNHSLAKSGDKHLLHSSRKVSQLNADLLKSMTQSGIGATNAFNFLPTEVDGVENMQCTKIDAFNFIQRDKRSRIESGDANSRLQLFIERQTDDCLFAWDFETDEEGRLKNFIWSDGNSRLDYDCFGDVVVFDTSYRLNKYNLCCGPFVGVNHHWQNVLFGVGFLSDETVESFRWLFRSFLRIMDEKHLITIFTDQDQAMGRAIDEIFPNTRHRLCQWHIYKKFPSKVHCGAGCKSLMDFFYKCMSQCDSEDEFDRNWEVMIESGGLHDNVWLDDLYNIRTKWSTAFNKDIFGMGILSTQRSESTNHVCHGVSKATSSITDCFLGLENVMTTWRRNERDEDFKCDQSFITLIAKSSPIAREAAAFYSRKIYSMFEEEFIHGSCGLQLVQSSTSEYEFLIQNLGMHQSGKVWIVTFDKLTSDVSCTCKKFEMMGLLCSHRIRVLNYHNVRKFPEKYLLLRWSTNAKLDVYKNFGYLHTERCGSQSGKLGSLLFRTHVQKFTYQIANKGQGNLGAEQCILESLNKLSVDVDNIMYGRCPQPIKSHKKKKQVNVDVQFNDPSKMRPKGISNSRLKGHWEKNKKGKGKQKQVAMGEGTAVGTSSKPYISSIPDFLTQEWPSTQTRESYTNMMMDSLM